MKGNFNQLINAEKPVFIDFFTDWCGPCKALSPIISELAKEVKDKVRVLKIDVDKNQAIAQKFGIKGVPTMILFKKGEAVWRESGVLSKQRLVQVIEQHTQ